MKQIKMNDWKEPDFGTRETGMKVPDGFFADFQQSLELKIDELEARKVREEAPSILSEQQHRSHRLPWWSVAASVALIAGLFVWFNPAKTTDPNAPESYMPVAEAMVENSDLSESMMLASLSDYDIYEALYAED